MPSTRCTLKIGCTSEDQRGDARLQRQDALRPGHELHHHMAVEVLQRNRDGGKPEQSAGRRATAGSRYRQTRKWRGCARSNSRRCVSSEIPTKHIRPATPPATIASICLKLCETAQHVEHPDRRQKPYKMADKDDKNAYMEQVGAPHQLPPPQQLARSGPPGVLLAIEPEQAAEQKHRQTEVGIPAVHNRIDRFHRARSSLQG